MPKIVIDCPNPNDLNSLQAAIEKHFGKCNVTYAEQAKAMIEAGTVESRREAAREIAKDTEETPKAIVMKAVTKNIEYGTSMTVQRQKIGDGTKAMALKIMKLDNKDFTECFKMDLLRVADGMAEQECYEVPIIKPLTRKETICAIAATDGRISLPPDEAL